MDDTEKMADVISMGIELGSSTDTIAKETYRALMNAVPDLVWEDDIDGGFKSRYFQIKKYGDGMFELNGRILTNGPFSNKGLFYRSEEVAKAAANARHRELVREILGGKSDE